MQKNLCRAALAAPILATALAGGAGPAAAAPETYLIDPAHTFPQFELSHLGFSRHRGRFDRSSGRIELDLAARTGRVEVSIATASIDTGDEKLETVLKSDAFFDVERHPAMVFRSSTLVFEGERPVAAEGEFTLLGVTRPLRLEIDHFHCGLVILGLRWVCGANATARLSRSAFGMDKYISLGLGDEVRITIQVEAQRETPPAPPAEP